ncbi:EAL domain-containing protein [Christensenella sp.]|uniref:EAL domain-containing protein n=1 Tax=Christensenella sp. TaxID=1935934 RepID=UPI002B1E9C9D|nr:EAL domain-containing protein [Christensenella sp.]
MRVGVFALDGFYGKDANGQNVGYGFDYLDELSKYSGLTFEYVYGTWDECLKRLEAGEIDLLDYALKTPEREAKFAFASYPTGTSFGRMYALSDNEALTYNDYAAFNGIKVGFMAANGRNDEFRKYEQEHGFAVTEVLYPDIESLQDALHAGEVDAIVVNNQRNAQEEKPVAQFAPASFYMMTAKTNTQLIGKIDEALEQIKIDKPSFDDALYQEHFGGNTGQLLLTAREIEYIKTAPPIRFVCDEAWAPFESIDADGKPQGINVDVLGLIAEKTGLAFDFVGGYAYDKAIDMVGDGEVDMLLSYDNNPDEARNRNISLSDTFLKSPIVIVGATTAIAPDDVFALPSIYVPHQEYAQSYYPDNKIVYYDNVEDCYQAIEAGAADFTMENLYAATDAIHKRYASLMISTVTTLSDEFSFALRKDTDPILIGILNKSIPSISETQFNSLLLENTSAQQQTSPLILFIEQYSTQIMVIMLFIIGVMIASIIYIVLSQKENKRRLWEMAYIDPLTGLGNLNKFKKDAQELLEQNKSATYNMVKLDVRGFNLINELYGFEEGNRVLRGVAEAVGLFVNPETDTYAHLNDDEFALLKAYDGPDEARRNTDDDLQTFKKNVSRLTGHNLRFSVGRYMIGPEQTDIEDIFEKVNYAHNLARKNPDGREQVNYDEKLKAKAIRTQEIESTMEEAMQRGEFRVYLQPKYRLNDEKLVGAEALARWRKPDGTVVDPIEFIPVFEQNGFVVKLDLYMFTQVCAILKGWMEKGEKLIPISVNFSRLHLSNPEFVEDLSRIANEYGVPKKYLEIELTETAIVGNESVLKKVLVALHKEGFTLSMDDFGSGYSSLGLLKDLVVDVIKIDRAFFADSNDKERANTVIRNIIKMANELGIRTVAEGVETVDHVDFLRDAGCDSVQGYYFAKPMPAEDFFSHNGEEGQEKNQEKNQ